MVQEFQLNLQKISFENTKKCFQTNYTIIQFYASCLFNIHLKYPLQIKIRTVKDFIF